MDLDRPQQQQGADAASHPVLEDGEDVGRFRITIKNPAQTFEDFHCEVCTWSMGDAQVYSLLYKGTNDMESVWIKGIALWKVSRQSKSTGAKGMASNDLSLNRRL